MLVVLEGLHSAGKSTQAALLTRLLRERGIPAVSTSWNSSVPLGRTITDLKIANDVGPTAMVLMEAADLAYRYEQDLRAALDRGVVVSDRYFYSTVVRGVVRGVDEAYIRSCFAFAPRPDLVFHLRCAASVTLARRERLGLSLGGHLSGADHRVITDPRQDFLTHQDDMTRQYERVLPETTVPLDATAEPAEVHRLIAERVIAELASRASGARAEPATAERSDA